MQADWTVKKTKQKKNINFEFIFKLNFVFDESTEQINFLSWCKNFSLSWVNPRKDGFKSVEASSPLHLRVEM